MLFVFISMYVKENNRWRIVGSYYVKSNNGWVEIPESQLSSVTNSKILNYGGYIDDSNYMLSIMGPSTVTGESCQYRLTKNGVIVPPIMLSWSVLSGSSYATIDSNGELTILPGASNSDVVISATYMTKTKTKALKLTYQENVIVETTTETETIEISGETIEITTTTTEITDESGNTTVTTNIIEARTNESGETTCIETKEIVNPDGSSNSEQINYNSSGDPTNKISTSGDTEGNVNTQSVEFNEQGDEIVVGYEIDTTGSGGEGKEIMGDGVNTEFVPFADNDCGFICHMKFRTVMSEQPRPPLVEDTEDKGSNWLYNIMSAKSPFKGDSSWPGFDIRWAIDKKTGTNGNIQFRYSSSGSTSTTARSMYGKNEAGTTSGNIFDLIITYDPQLILPTSRTTFSVTSPNGCISSIGANVLFDSNNIDFTIGYATSMAGTPYRYSDVTIYEFTITKVCTAPIIVPDEPIISCDGKKVTITCATPNASIYYRLNETGNYISYTSPITINADTVVQAYSELMGQTSDITIETCLYEGGVEPPVINCDGEEVTMTCETPSADVYYSINQEEIYVLYESPISISADTIFHAFSELNGESSTTVTVTCIYDDELKAPAIICDGEEVTITCLTPGAIIHYKLNQDEIYSLYENPFAITADTVVHAYSEFSGETSTVVTETCIYSHTHDYSQDYLTLNVLTGGTIVWKCVGSTTSAKTISYSVDNGQNWSAITSTSAGVPISVNAGNKVLIKGTNPAYSKDKNNYSGFEGGKAKYDIEGNIMSLIGGDNFTGITAFTKNFAFCSLFKLSNAISAKNMILPVLTLREASYRAMFSKAPYLVEAPALPATTLAKDCYWYMFEECPITNAPELPATTLVQGCYGYMFTKCGSLNYIKCMATDISASACTISWVNAVAATGTFVKESTMTSWTRGTSGIPNGWTIYNDEMLYNPSISCDGENVTITCNTSGANIFFDLNQSGDYSAYTDSISISADTFVEAYSTLGNQSSNTVSQNCEYIPHLYKFAKLEIAHGPLYCGSNGYEIKDSWNYDSYNSIYGEYVGSTYFNFIEMGQLFDESGFTVSDGDILNRLEPFENGWRIPTKEEWESIISTGTTIREGSTVNNSANKRYALIQLTGVSHAGNSTPYGLLLFPDGETITGVTLTNLDNATANIGITESQLDEYLNQGCAFILASGSYAGQWNDGGNEGNYWASTEFDSASGNTICFANNSITNKTVNKISGYNAVRLVREASYGIETPLSASNKSLNNWNI